MPKRLKDYNIYVAPGISGVINKDGTISIYNEHTSSYYILDEIDLKCKVEIYEKQVKGWFLDVARGLTGNSNAGFVILMVALSYIEGVEQYRKGRGSRNNSREIFGKGMQRIFPEKRFSNIQLKEIYKHTRCGLFHNGMTGGPVLISDRYNCAISVEDDGTIFINTVKFLGAIVKDFDNYIIELKKNEDSNLKDNFNRMFKLD